MINREIIRLKIVQLVYAYYQNEGKNIEVAEKELRFSLSKAYDMYNYLLLLLVETRHVAENVSNAKKQRADRLKMVEAGGADKKYAANKFLIQLENNKQLIENVENMKLSWIENDAFVKKLYKTFIGSEFFDNYTNLENPTYEDDKELMRKLYKKFIQNNDEFDSILEELSLYWNDDKEIVDSFVVKTIKRFDEAAGNDFPLLPEYANDDDKKFATDLFKYALENADYYRQLIKENTKNWEFSRLTFMDVIIMQIALAEILCFSNIPLKVSFNEYLDIAKVYSTPKSSSYINGMLDNICKKLKDDNLLLK